MKTFVLLATLALTAWFLLVGMRPRLLSTDSPPERVPFASEAGQSARAVTFESLTKSSLRTLVCYDCRPNSWPCEKDTYTNHLVIAERFDDGQWVCGANYGVRDGRPE